MISTNRFWKLFFLGVLIWVISLLVALSYDKIEIFLFGTLIYCIYIIIIGLKWEAYRKSKKLKKEESNYSDVIVISNGYEYENFVAHRLKTYSGFTDVKTTPKSGDFGADILGIRNGKKYAIQCKYYTKNVGVESVQQVLAGKAYYDCDGAIVITNSTFTKSAKEMARKTGVELKEKYI